MKALILILAFLCIIIVVFPQLGQATPIVVVRPQMKMNESFKLNQTKQNQTRPDGTCFYRVTIETSCSSPRITTNEIDIKFGDAYGSEVYVSQLDAIDGVDFGRCSAAAFDITSETCCKRICKIYLFSRGHDGWAPSYVSIDDYNYPPTPFFFYNPIIFYSDSRNVDDYCGIGSSSPSLSPYISLHPLYLSLYSLSLIIIFQLF